ncbi:MAG: undecaprenyl-phosphate glucose phosphotransferase [Pararhodobacter sp.]|nr:undecaprenyl-phosphate glucose phosphotransferase [Pararhodobacter sp.]
MDKSLFRNTVLRNRGARAFGAMTASGRLLSSQAQAEAQRLNRPAVRPALFSSLLQVSDLLAVVMTGLLALALVPDSLPEAQRHLTVLLGAILVVAAIHLLGAYRFRRMRALGPGLGLMWAGMTLGYTAFIVLVWGLDWAQTGLARAMAIWWGLANVAMTAARVLIWLRIRILTKTGRMEHRIVLVGGTESLAPLIREIDSEKKRGRRLCGFFDERRDGRSPSTVAGHHKMGDIDDLLAFVRSAHIDTVIVAIPKITHRRLMELAARLFVLPVDIRVLADADIPQFSRNKRSKIGKFRMIDLYKRPIHGWEAVRKRVFDVVLSILAIIVFAPVMAAVALAIRLDSPGPVLFRQRRHGFNNRPIEVLKFRSMYTDRADPSAVRAVQRNDDRVTKVGRFIRRTSLDELPQFFNVLKGDLSLVGPRPHATAARTGDLVYDAVTEAYSARHKVRPGVTGWAQINGWRGEMDTPEKIRTRVEHDLYYIENWSLWMDLKILALTPISLITTKNAY